MAIATPSVSSTPFAKLVSVGDTLVGAYGGSLTRQRHKFQAPETLLFKDNGKPLLEEVLYLVAMPGTTAKTGDAEKGTVAVIEPEAVVRYSVSGFKWGQVIEARKGLPAFSGFGASQTCSSDVYTFRLVGWSVGTDNPEAAGRAGFTVVDKRIVIREEADLDRYVLQRTKAGQNANVGKDLEVTIRRIDQTAEKRFEQLADELYLSKPWERTGAEPTPDYAPSGPHPADAADDEEPF